MVMHSGHGYSARGDSQAAVRTHQCNCIGCCDKCGQCLTTPWHVETCKEISLLEAAKGTIIGKAIERKKR